MAGNIIPAIATTNAIIGGLMMEQGTRVLTNMHAREQDPSAGVALTDGCRGIYLMHGNRSQLYSSASLPPPNPACAVCSVSCVTFHADLTSATLHDLLGLLGKDVGQLSVNHDSRCVGMKGFVASDNGQAAARP